MRLRWWLALATALAAAVAAGVLLWPRPTALDRAETKPAAAQPMIVRDVLDGDTVVLEVQRPGTQVHEPGLVTAQLIGINSPNFGLIHECFAVEAEAKLSELLPKGSVAWATLDEVPKDELGRWFMYLWTAGGSFVNLNLAASGYVTAEPSPPNDAHTAVLSAAEKRAIERQLGLWRDCA